MTAPMLQRWRTHGRARRPSSTRDEATGLMHAAAFHVVGAHALRQAAADGQSAGLVLVRLGEDPPSGVAQALECTDNTRLAASLLAGETRGEDVLARTGTRELCALMPGYGPDECARAAARVREAFVLVGAFDSSPPCAALTVVGSASVTPSRVAGEADVVALVAAARQCAQ